MTQVHRASLINQRYYLTCLSEEAQYRYSCISKYKTLRKKGFSEEEALGFLEAKRPTFFDRLKTQRTQSKK